MKTKQGDSKPMEISKFIEGLIREYRSKKITVDVGRVECDFIDTGNYALNYIMSGSFDYGVPVGQVTEIHGDPSSGKSLLLYNIISNFQKKYEDGVVILDDSEFSYVDYLGSTLEIDGSRLIRLSSSTVEEHAATIFIGGRVPVQKGSEVEEVVVQPLVEKLTSQGVKHILVAIDSIAVLSTKHEVGVGLDKPDMSKAKTIKALLRVVMPVIKRHNITYIVTNHLIFSIGSLIPQKVTPGGSGVVYQSSVRLCLTPTGKIKLKDTNTVAGVVSKVQTVKNRFAPPLRTCELEISFSKGMSKYSGLISLFTNLGIIELAPGGWYRVKGTGNQDGSEFKFQSKDVESKWEDLRKIVSASNVLMREETVVSSYKDEGEFGA